MMKAPVFFLLLLLSSAAAQNAICLDAMREAVTAALDQCAMMESNEVCYASGSQEIVARAASDVAYAAAGDVVGTGVVDVLSMSSTIEAPAIALLTPRANFVSGHVHMVAMGNISLQNLGNARSDFVAAEVSVGRRAGAQVYTQPNLPADEYLYWGYVARAIGRTNDSLWLLVLREDDSAIWVAAVDLDVDFDAALLPVVEPDDMPQPPYVGAMQAFTLISGVDDAPCVGQPESGLLVQAMSDAQEAYLLVNGLEIKFDGTLFLQAQPTAEMIVSVLEGAGLLGSGDELLTLNVGERLSYPFDGETVGAHGLPEAYHYVAARSLQTFFLLPRALELPFSTGGLLTAYRDGDFASVAVDAPCVVAWTVDVNLRAGPGTDYALLQGAAANQSALPDGRNQGTDGALWWRLAEGIWVNANNTIAAGACGALPLVTDPAL